MCVTQPTNSPGRLLADTGVHLLLRVVVLDVVVQQAGLPEGLGAAGGWTLERVVVQFDREDGRGLVLYDPVHWEVRRLDAQDFHKRCPSLCKVSVCVCVCVCALTWFSAELVCGGQVCLALHQDI